MALRSKALIFFKKINSWFLLRGERVLTQLSNRIETQIKGYHWNRLEEPRISLAMFWSRFLSSWRPSTTVCCDVKDAVKVPRYVIVNCKDSLLTFFQSHHIGSLWQGWKDSRERHRLPALFRDRHRFLFFGQATTQLRSAPGASAIQQKTLWTKRG